MGEREAVLSQSMGWRSRNNVAEAQTGKQVARCEDQELVVAIYLFQFYSGRSINRGPDKPKSHLPYLMCTVAFATCLCDATCFTSYDACWPC